MASTEERLCALERNSMETLQHVTEIKMAVCGSEKLGVEGIAQKVSKHEKYIEIDKRQKWLLTGAISVIAASAGAFWNKIF